MLAMNSLPEYAVKSDDARSSKRACLPYALRNAEDGAVAAKELPPGSHIVTPRRGYLHHGIYVGGGKVVHYTGLANGLRRGAVRETSLAGFARGRAVWLRANAPNSFDRREVINRARSRLGEDSYRILTNNCEHFCEWCLHGEHRSYQVEAWLVRRGSVLRATIRFIAQLCFGHDGGALLGGPKDM
jgi:hypothetical protein